VLIPPEWLTERPAEVIGILRRHPPQHLTAGPALLHALARTLREVPELRRVLRRQLKCIVASGAPFDPRLRELLPGVRLANAFGMTETQQVLNTLLESEAEGNSLGSPLPGVSVGVKFSDPKERIGELFVRTTFAATGYLHEPDFPEWLATGDLVRCVGNRLEHLGRVQDDFINTGLGAKLALRAVEQRLAAQLPEASGVFAYTAPELSGVVALVYVGDRAADDPQVHRQLREACRQQRGDLLDQVQALGCVAGLPPSLGPGKWDRRRIELDNADLLTALRDPTSNHPHLVPLEASPLEPSEADAHAYPRLGRLFKALQIDVNYVRGEGNWLIQDNPDQTRVLDLAGGFGANLLGHAHPEILEAARTALGGVPLLDQASGRQAARQLAQTLSDRIHRETGREYVVCLASTGSEAVELALKHALLERQARFQRFQRRLIEEFHAQAPELVEECLAHNEREFFGHAPELIALDQAFHGRTTGALHALGDFPKRRPFMPLRRLGGSFLPWDGSPMRELPAALRANAAMQLRGITRDPDGALRSAAVPFVDILAVLAEPMQGEGGINEVPLDWLQRLKELEAPLILDEIQCGLGRSGAFLASRGVVGDYYLLGKALGGGVAKVAALLIDQTRYCDEFDEERLATFSDDAFSVRVASRVLDIIEREDVPRRAASAGALLKERLEKLRERYPSVIRAVRGRGLMLGIELDLPNAGHSMVLKALAEQHLGFLATAYLLHQQRIRVFPTTLSPRTLRIEPSAYLTEAEVDQALRGLEGLCERLVAGDLAGLLIRAGGVSPLSSGGLYQGAYAPRSDVDVPGSDAQRVAFIHHPLEADRELIGDCPELAALPVEQRLDLIERLVTLLELRPLLSLQQPLFDGQVTLNTILLPAPPQLLLQLHRLQDLDLVRQRLQEAVNLAARLGCRTIVMGGLTSSLTRNALTLRAPAGVTISTGNTLTTAILWHDVQAACRKRGIDLGDPRKRVAIVGALGNIGKALTQLGIDDPALRCSLLLVGRAGSKERLAAFRAGFRTAKQDLAISTELQELRSADVIMIAASAGRPLIYPQHVAADRPVIIADVSQPRGLAPGLAEARSNVWVLSTGVALLPRDLDVRLSPYTPAGMSFACTGEAILLGAAHQLTPPALCARLRGDIDVLAVRVLTELAAQWGMLRT
jgi:acetylornithine/succinyldiaminopimelate/putrescine aminotransferase/predicted amino acid dehydrogenase